MITDLETQIWKQAYEAQRNRMRVETIADEMAIRYADGALAEYQADTARRVSERRANRT
jgi:hypothetical protein